MKKQLFLLFAVLVLSSGHLIAQSKTIYLTETAGVFAIGTKNGAGTFTAMTDADLKALVIKGGLKFDRSGLAATTTMKIESKAAAGTLTDVTAVTATFRLAANQYTFVGGDANAAIKILKITLTPAAPAVAKTYDDIGSTAPPETPDPQTNNNTAYASWRDYVINNKSPYLNIIKGRQRYFPDRNIAYICIDPYGNIIGKKPVNLDQDDDIVLLMIVPDDASYDNYSVNDNDAQYAPTDLAFRPSDALNNNVINSEDKTPVKYTVKAFDKGPYTSSDVTFTLMNGTKVLNEFTVHINPLYHLGLGVSYVSTSLESPDYQLVPLTSTTNTIKAVNTGRRTFLTVNAIWYWWSTFKYFKGDPLTRGRDVLKEPNLITRINPTFGVGLKGNLENNFFGGFNFEFARGGSLSAGWHYGKVTKLLDDKFQLGVSEFAGQQADIKTTDSWRWGGFFGVTLDTRIFNRLFSSSKATP
ncbi:hypothetical protein SAMN05216464_113143 [Mucilaginibacter pineti]|uniref:Uncharacterized protein n=1 Tax=Mucilaginibacter pineti TaxID=1391627 RepID=A0A1G7IS93_9SPHI|nr:hypothetical protein [Mucilaginibacter pineti]SDF15541.1 hypothetical protein SAMN05216464_113143 [Mucilaginibacter pineti]